jgi:hypothetical protein
LSRFNVDFAQIEMEKEGAGTFGGQAKLTVTSVTVAWPVSACSALEHRRQRHLDFETAATIDTQPQLVVDDHRGGVTG